jgi:hypothetical protein
MLDLLGAHKVPNCSALSRVGLLERRRQPDFPAPAAELRCRPVWTGDDPIEYAASLKADRAGARRCNTGRASTASSGRLIVASSRSRSCSVHEGHQGARVGVSAVSGAPELARKWARLLHREGTRTRRLGITVPRLAALECATALPRASQCPNLACEPEGYECPQPEHPTAEYPADISCNRPGWRDSFEGSDSGGARRIELAAGLRRLTGAPCQMA